MSETLLAFTLASVLIELTPGPNMAWLAILTLSEGRRPGYAAVAGVALGLATVGALAAAGVAALVTASEPAYQVLRFGGVAYLLWLAWDGWRDHGPEEGGPAPTSQWRAFRRGLVTNLLNPKAAVFYIAVLPAFLPGTEAALHDTLTLTAIYVAVATVIHGGIVTAAGAAKAFFDNPARERMARRVLSVLLALVALWFGWKTGR